MKKFKYLIFIAFVIESCAYLDGYKDARDGEYSNYLTRSEKKLLKDGKTISKIIDRPTTIGELIVTKGNPKYGKYNFVEVGEWKHYVFYTFGDSTVKVMMVSNTYDSYGNILSGSQLGKGKRDNEFYKTIIRTSELSVFGTDTILIQKVKTFRNDLNNMLIRETNLGVLNYKEKLSDRLKTKIKVGKEIVFDEAGSVKSEKHFRYEDKVKAR